MPGNLSGITERIKDAVLKQRTPSKSAHTQRAVEHKMRNSARENELKRKQEFRKYIANQ